jgi:hypothetical protein
MMAWGGRRDVPTPPVRRAREATRTDAAEAL